jgi:hypothetical protein
MRPSRRSATIIHSTSELLDRLKALRTDALGPLWFRGHARADWTLLPWARRGYSREQERQFTHGFFARARTRHPSCPRDEDGAAWLALMQHYKVPTRLLDWTSSPLVAAFFATAHHRLDTVTDAAIWCLSPMLLNESQGWEPLVYPLNSQTLAPLIDPAFKGDEREERVAAAWPLESDNRMLIQQSGFTVHGSCIPLEQLPGREAWLRQITIPAAAVADFRAELNALGVRVSDLFPDLEHLALELRETIQIGDGRTDERSQTGATTTRPD